jgi:hypothetical protein
MAEKKKGSKFVWLVLFAGLGYAGWRVGPDLRVAYNQGLFEQTKQVAYDGTTLDNLKAIHTAMMLYHESEGAFPTAASWMDKIENRLQTNDLKTGEGAKKLLNPATGKYSWSYNSAAAGQYKDDLPEKDKTVLIWATFAPEKNQNGKPENPYLAILIDGTILENGKPQAATSSSQR